MHELSVATDLLELALGAAEGRRIEKLTLSNGAFSGVFEESLRFYLELLMEERQGKGAAIEILTLPARCACACGETYETLRFLDPCPHCGHWNRKVESGMDCRLESIEVPAADPPK